MLPTISSVRMGDASRQNGNVITIMTVETGVMKPNVTKVCNSPFKALLHQVLCLPYMTRLH